MASEDEYLLKLIELVQKYPVLYEVDLIDYKNKNKKGEAFKQVQKELKEAGYSEFQAQSTYKKWISLKRKFRVEYFRLKMEEETKGVGNVTSSFRFYNNLTFLIPYCKYYKGLKSTLKRKCVDDDDESDDERFSNLQFNDVVDNNFNNLLTIDNFFNTKRIKCDDEKIDSQLLLKQLQNDKQFSIENQIKFSSNNLLINQSNNNQLNNENNLFLKDYDKKINTNEILLSNNNDSEPSTSNGINKMLDEKQLNETNFELNSLNKITNANLQNLSLNTLTPTEKTIIDPLSVLTQRELINFQKKFHSIITQTSSTQQTLNQLNDSNKLAPIVYNDEANSPALETLTKESENALFGRLVASELDKIPENMHNIVRAQVLLLLAHATSNTNNNMFNGMNKLYTGLFHM